MVHTHPQAVAKVLEGAGGNGSKLCDGCFCAFTSLARVDEDWEEGGGGVHHSHHQKEQKVEQHVLLHLEYS